MNEFDAIVDRARERVNAVCNEATAKLEENEQQMRKRITVFLFAYVPTAVVAATFAFGLTSIALEFLAAYLRAP